MILAGWLANLVDHLATAAIKAVNAGTFRGHWLGQAVLISLQEHVRVTARDLGR
jgi:hypothetical protein